MTSPFFLGVCMRRSFLIGSLALGLSVSSVTAAPVDTHDYGFITPGSNVASVIERVGPPDERQLVSRVYRHVRGGLVEVVIEELVWRGDSQVMRTILTTANGIVQTKQKVHEP